MMRFLKFSAAVFVALLTAACVSCSPGAPPDTMDDDVIGLVLDDMIKPSVRNTPTRAYLVSVRDPKQETAPRLQQFAIDKLRAAGLDAVADSPEARNEPKHPASISISWSIESGQIEVYFSIYTGPLGAASYTYKIKRVAGKAVIERREQTLVS